METRGHLPRQLKTKDRSRGCSRCCHSSRGRSRHRREGTRAEVVMAWGGRAAENGARAEARDGSAPASRPTEGVPPCGPQAGGADAVEELPTTRESSPAGSGALQPEPEGPRQGKAAASSGEGAAAGCGGQQPGKEGEQPAVEGGGSSTPRGTATAGDPVEDGGGRNTPGAVLTWLARGATVPAKETEGVGEAPPAWSSGSRGARRARQARRGRRPASPATGHVRRPRAGR